MAYNFSLNRKTSIANHQSGFTLIELLVVIAIISVLAGLLMANFVGVRMRGRDAERKSELRQIQAALELYRSDNARYPISLPNCDDALVENGVTYMQKFPCDSLDDAPYPYNSDGFTYEIYACLENVNDSDKDESSQACSTGASFTVNNP